MRDSSPHFGKALEKGLDLVERLAAGPAPLGFTDLRATLDVSPASFARFLKLLAARGYVAREASGKYHLGWRLAQLGQVALESSPLRRLSEPHLTAIREATQETAEVAAFQEGHFQFLARLESPQSILLRARPGSRFGISMETAIGALAKALGLGSGKPLPGKRGAAIRAELFADQFQNNNEAYRAAAAVSDATGRCIGCLIVAAPAFRVTLKQRRLFKQVLCVQARELSRALGGICMNGPATKDTRTVKGKTP